MTKKSKNLFGVTKNTGGESKPSVPPGNHDAVIHAIIQYGLQKRKYKGQEQDPKNIIKILLEVPSLSEEGESALIGYREVTAVINEKSNFFKLFKSVGLVNNTDDLVELFSDEKSVRSILGAACNITVEEVDIEGKTVSMVSEVTKLDPRLPQPVPTLDGFLFNFTDPDIEVFKNKLTKYGRSRIMHALNAEELPREFHQYYADELAADKENKKENVLK